MIMQNATNPVMAFYIQEMNKDQFWYIRSYSGNKGFVDRVKGNLGITITDTAFTYGSGTVETGEVHYVIVY